MPLHIVSLFDVLLGLRELVFRSNAVANSFDLVCPDLFSGYCAGAVHLCWISGELPLWATAQGGGLEQVAWRPGRFVDWPGNCDIAIAEYPGVGLLLLNEEPSLHRREIIATSAAGAERLRAFVQAEVPKRMTDAMLKEWIPAQGTRSTDKLWAIAQQLGDWKPPRARLRRVHDVVKLENKDLQPTRGPRPKQ